MGHLMDGNSLENHAFNRRTLLRNGMLAGLSVAAVGVAGSARAASAARASQPASSSTGAVGPADSITGPTQSGWAFCDKCKVLYYGVEQSASVCPKGGTHGGGSGDYYVYFNISGTPTDTQQGWQFCDKCKGMYYWPEQSASACPAGGAHGGPSASYTMLYS